MRTLGMITLSEPTVTSSPIATPSCTRTCARRSHDRPTIAPSTTADRPIEVDVSTIEGAVRARSQRHAGPAPGVGAARRVRRDAAVVPEERRSFERVEVVQVDALADPDV